MGGDVGEAFPALYGREDQSLIYTGGKHPGQVIPQGSLCRVTGLLLVDLGTESSPQEHRHWFKFWHHLSPTV